MSIGTLEDIILKARKLSSTGSDLSLTQAQVIDYINSFYLYDLPANMRCLKLQDKYTFNTIRGIDCYPFDSEHYTTVQMPCYCAKREIKLFQDPWSFYGVNFNWQYQVNFATGDGTTGSISGSITAITNASNGQVTSANHGLATGNVVLITGVLGMTEVNNVVFTITVNSANTFLLNVNTSAFGVYISGGTFSKTGYTGTLSAVPIIRSVNNNPMVKTPQNPTTPYYPTPSQPNFSQSMIPSRVQNILITASNTLGSTLNVTDDGNGNLIGDGIGTIDYSTGEISIIFNTPVAQGIPIQIQYNPMVNQMAIPQSILYFQNQFTLRPVPDKGYTIEMVAYRQPSQALLGSTDSDAPNLQGVPELTEWWELLAVGAAKKIYEDKLDTDGMMIMDKMLQERYEVAETRTYAQLGKQSMSTLFRDQLSHNYGASGWGAGAGGSV